MKRALVVFTVLLCALSLVAQEKSPKSASIGTDKLDYRPGDTIVITGQNWQGGEMVNLTLHQVPTRHADVVWSTPADSAGAVRDTNYVVQQQDLGTKFTLTAVGSKSGAVATVQFLDASTTVFAGTNPYVL